MIMSLRLFRKARRGNAATEFAFILPIMLLFMGGIVECGRFFQTYNAVNRLATRYASVYSDCNDGSDTAGSDPTPCGNGSTGELQYYWPAAAIKNIAPQLSNGSTAVRMFEVSYSNAGTASIVNSYPAGNTMTVAEAQKAQAAIYVAPYPGQNKPQVGVVVTVSYHHTFDFFSSVSQYFPNFSLNCPSASPTCVSYTVAQRKT